MKGKNMEIRRIQMTGGSSYIVTLPKEWIKSLNIKKNDQIGLITQSDGTLLVTPKIDREQTQRVREFDVSNDPIISFYSDSEHVTIRMNDLSLPMGGRFDIMGLWNGSTEHISHRWGYEADVSFNGFTLTHPYRQLLIEAFTERCGRKPKIDYLGHIHAYLCRRYNQWFPPN